MIGERTTISSTWNTRSPNSRTRSSCSLKLRFSPPNSLVSSSTLGIRIGQLLASDFAETSLIQSSTSARSSGHCSFNSSVCRDASGAMSTPRSTNPPMTPMYASPVPAARGMRRCWRKVTTGLRRNTIAPAKIKGGKTTRNTQAMKPSSPTSAARPSTAQAMVPARRIRSTMVVKVTTTARQAFWRSGTTPPVAFLRQKGRVGSGVHRGATVGPGPGGLELCGHPDQDVLTTVRRDELDADRQSRIVPVQRQRDAGLAGDVELRRVLEQLAHPLGALLGVGQPPEERRRPAEHRRQQQVPALEVPP